MRDESMHNLLRSVDAPATPRADFADRLLESLIEQLEIDQPSNGGTSEPPRTPGFRRLFGGRFLLIAATLGLFGLILTLLVKSFAPVGPGPTSGTSPSVTGLPDGLSTMRVRFGPGASPWATGRCGSGTGSG